MMRNYNKISIKSFEKTLHLPLKNEFVDCWMAVDQLKTYSQFSG